MNISGEIGKLDTFDVSNKLFSKIHKLKINYKTFLDKNRYNKKINIKTIFHNKINVIQYDQTASSFPLKIVEDLLKKYVYPYYTNTHSNNYLGRLMSDMMVKSKDIIMKSVNASSDNYKVIYSGSGTSAAVTHLTHLIEPNLKKSVVFVSVLEHYSNYLPWYHKAKEIVVIDVDKNGIIDTNKLKNKIIQYKKKYKYLYGAFSAASNVTGVIQPVDKISKICHAYGAYVFFDYACSAPYVKINLNNNNADGIYFSPHKFYGGQGTPGILIINKNIICNKISYTPSGGTVRFMCSNSGPIYSNDIEKKENGGTPNIIGIIRTALAIQIKDNYIKTIERDEKKLTKIFSKRLLKLQKKCENLIILNGLENKHRLPIFSFQIKNFHYNYIVALLSDLYGITTRGGVSCSGVLAEKLLNLSKDDMKCVLNSIMNGEGVKNDYGWIRITLNSIHSENDIQKLINAIEFICKNANNYTKYYKYDPNKNIYV